MSGAVILHKISLCLILLSYKRDVVHPVSVLKKGMGLRVAAEPYLNYRFCVIRRGTSCSALYHCRLPFVIATLITPSSQLSICLIIVCVNIRTLFVTAKSFFGLVAFYCMSNGAELAPLQAVLNRNANLLRGTLFKIGLLFYYLISVGAEQIPVVAVVYLYFKYVLIVR